MDRLNIAGKEVTLAALEGPIVRRVVEIRGEVVVVARDEELEKAKREGRPPLLVGFRTKDILKIGG